MKIRFNCERALAQNSSGMVMSIYRMVAADWVEIMRSIYSLDTRSIRIINHNGNNETEHITRLNLWEWKSGTHILESDFTFKQRENLTARELCLRNSKIQLVKFCWYSQRSKHIYSVSMLPPVAIYLIMSTILLVDGRNKPSHWLHTIFSAQVFCAKLQQQ